MEALTGNNPFQRENMAATFMAILNEPPPALDDIPVEVQQVVYRCLSKDPDKRYQSCAEMLRDLEDRKGGAGRCGMGLPPATAKLSAKSRPCASPGRRLRVRPGRCRRSLALT